MLNARGHLTHGLGSTAVAALVLATGCRFAGISLRALAAQDAGRPALMWVGLKRLPGYTAKMTPTPIYVSDDGSVVYGEFDDESDRNSSVHFFRWSRQGTIDEVSAAELPKNVVPTRPGSHSYAVQAYVDLAYSGGNKIAALVREHNLPSGIRGVSNDGTVLLGSYGSAESVSYPYLWTQATGTVRLKDYSEHVMRIRTKLTGYPHAASDDGTVIAGVPDSPDGVLTDVWVLQDPLGFGAKKTSSSTASTTHSTARILPPGEILGKTFEQCDAILGNPALRMSPKGDKRSYQCFYKSLWPGVSRILLERVPEGSMSGPVPQTVNFVTYEFPAGTATWQTAFANLGLNTQGVKVIGDSFCEISAIAGGLTAYWTPASDAVKGPPEYRHPNDDSIGFRKQ